MVPYKSDWLISQTAGKLDLQTWPTLEFEPVPHLTDVGECMTNKTSFQLKHCSEICCFRSVVQLCLLCTLILINTTLLNADTLFSHDSDVVQLSANDFSSVIYGSSRLWMVDFYLSWCGACRRFAPVYSSLATSIKGNHSTLNMNSRLLHYMYTL